MTNFLILLGIVVALLAIAFLGIGVKILFHKSKKFPETSAGHNKELRKRGVTCPRHDEMKCWSQKEDKKCATCFEGARE